MIQHQAFFGDGDKTFALTPEIIDELQRKTGVGIGELYRRFMQQDFRFADITEIIRLALIGGGTAPVDAQTLVDTFAKPRPIMEILPLAFDILDAKWNGKPEPVATVEHDDDFDFPQDDIRDAAATGDMAAAINEAMQEAGL